MARIYKALLHRDRLEWLGEAPQSQTGHPRRVRVTVEESEASIEEAGKGSVMAAVLEKLAARGVLFGHYGPSPMAT